MYGWVVVTVATRSTPSVARGGRGGGAHRAFVDAERSGDRAVVAQVTRETPGVDAGDAGHTVMAQQLVERALRTPVARSISEVAHHDARAERAGALEVVGVHAVVADVRIREGDHLACVRRIGDDLLVARQRRVEHELAGGHGARILDQRADGFPFELFAVGKDQQRGGGTGSGHRADTPATRDPSTTTGVPRRTV